MKKIILFLAMFGLTFGSLHLNSQVTSFNLANKTETDAFVASLPAGYASTGTITSNQWGGTYGVKIGANSSLTYSATGLAAGDYTLEANVMIQNVAHTWIQDVWATGGSVATPIVQTGTAGTYVTYTETVTVPSTGNYTFGIVRGNHGSQLYVQSWSITGGAAAESTETDITAFTLAAQTGNATIDTDAHTVAIEVAYGTSLASLSPTITLSSGATVSPLSGAAQDFSGGAVNYTVTAEDGTTTQVWAVTVTAGAASTETDITSFTLTEQAGSATIDTGVHTVAIEVTNGTDLTSLSPTITLSSGATVSPNTGVAQDFSGGAVTYTVTAEDGVTMQDWLVTVTEAAPSLDVFSFSLANQTETESFLNSTPAGFTITNGESNSWGGTYGVKLNANGSITYAVTGLAAGDYKFEATVMVQNTATVPWTMDGWLTSGSAPATSTPSDGTNGTFVTLTKTVTLAGGDTTLGVIRGGGSAQLYVSAFKVTAPATEVTSTGDGTWADATFGGTAPTATDNVVIDNVITLSSSATVNNLTIGAGSLTIINGGTLIVNGTASGNVAYQRTLTATDDSAAANLEGWFTVTPPVSGEALNTAWADANSLAIGTGSNRGLATYSENGDSLSYFTGTATTFVAGKGYIVKRTTDGTVTFTGTVNTSDAGVDVNVTKDGNGFNLLGSPYTSQINSATFISDNAANLALPQIWIWNDDGNTYNAKTAGLNFMLSPGQGFFVQANAAATLNFAESNQSSGIDTFQKSTDTKIKLNVFNGKTNRYAEVYYLNTASESYDYGFEGETFGGIPDSFSLFTHLLENNQGKNYQIQALPKSDFESMIVPVGIKIDGNQEITFTAEAVNLPEGIKVYLEDRVNNSFTRLDEVNTNYKVNLTNDSNETGRFYLHTRPSALSISDNALLETISIFKSDASTLKIAGLSQGKANVKLFNVLGKQMMNISFISNGIKEITLPKVAKGLYIVQIETEKGKLNKKIILE
jgi:hypothetical protein